jgi:hypothetical protein
MVNPYLPVLKYIYNENSHGKKSVAWKLNESKVAGKLA